MTLKEKILSMRMDEFGLAKQTFFGSDKDTFPYAIDVVKWMETESIQVFSVDEKRYVTRTSYCYVIGTLLWNDKEPGWDFKSCGTRFLEDGTHKLNLWLLDFCRTHEVCEGEIRYKEIDEEEL